MGKVALALVGLLLAALYGTAQTDAHLYSPGINLKRSELAQLETATHTVDIAMSLLEVRPNDLGAAAGGSAATGVVE